MRRALALAALVLAPAPVAHAAGPPPLSAERVRADISSDRGSGVFGRWARDAAGLPSYLYEIDHRRAPQAAQPELAGKRDAQHQLGNGRMIAMAYNRGHVQAWSQDRIYQWLNLAEPAQGQYGGGFGYLRVAGRTLTTHYEDLPPDAGVSRRFGTGYVERVVPARPVSVRERVYTPAGGGPVVLHDVVLRNHSDRPVAATWYEAWGVNPVQQLPGKRLHRAVARPAAGAAGRVLTVDQSDPQDSDPLTIYAAVVRGDVDGFETDATRFYGAGGRAAPAAVEADRLTNGIAPASPLETVSRTVLAFRSPVTVPARRSVTLRYAYGAAHREQIDAILARQRAAADPFGAMRAHWREVLPQITIGRDRSWLSRELQWSDYLLRSGTSYEEGCGHHIISQGGFYQYSLGFQGAYRDPLQHMLPVIWTDPETAREVLRYSAVTQSRTLAITPYAQLGMCRRFDFGTSNDLDLWLLLAAAEYGLSTRDIALFDERIPYSGGGSDTLWDHLKFGFRRQEAQRGPNGGYVMGATGDWSDFSTQFGPMTESLLVAAQTAFVYPRLAELADLRGDAAFAAELRETARELLGVVRRNWVGRGWYARAWAGTARLGEGAIYGEPQPWALLAGAPDRDQARTLVANILRYLTGVGAPAHLNGPSKIGSSASPSTHDPDVTERTPHSGVGGDNAVYVGGAWYAINGWLTWALGELDGIVPRARELAFDELLRNTLTAHSTAFPHHWNGTISVDDACRSYYDGEPGRCGVGLSTTVSGQIMHQPAWLLFGTIRLAGVTPTAAGWRVAPRLPVSRFRMTLPGVGLTREKGRLRGYFRTERDGTSELEVVVPERVRGVRAFVAGREVAARKQGRTVTFALPHRAGRPADWAVTYR